MTHSTVRTPHGASRRMVAMTVAAVVAALGMVAVSAGTAQAVARLTATSSLSGAVASTSGPTTFTVSGSGFQAVQGGFGGVYVGFGWVNGSNWGPSKGGATGTSYDYVPDEQSRSNKGYQAFVAFPGSETSGEAQGTMGADGSFRISLTVPGPTFTGAGGKRIDCRQVTCGFLTWGAHGVRNGANESFTPVTFQGGAAPAAPAESGAAPAQPSAEAPAAAGRAGSGRTADTAGRAGRAQTSIEAQGAPAVVAGGAETGAPAASTGGAGADGEASMPAEGPVDATGGTTLSGAAVIEVDRKSARAGGAMGFAAAGFWPGEQVYVVLGDGLAAVGPVVAGVDGEVAGVIVLPEGIEPGTHEIRAAGAGSGLEATERFPLRVDITPAASSSTLRDSMKWLFLALAALALLAVGAFVVKRRQDAADDADAQTTHPTTVTQEEVQR
ncbi:hypothetical protein [uncultured Dietzia sp.]|uniref:hypothetical protein n=1 Tax=uncultured Dietzia sp. TaxID=395519 RepID=UPI002613F4AE|nr:hypothetical protein [uncultured Dietzia sp.]